MFVWLALGAASILGWALYENNKPKAGGTTPLQNSLSGNPYQVGQTVRVPFNQLPPNTIPPKMFDTFQQVRAEGVKVKISSVNPGTISGTLVSTYGPEGDIQIPVTVPVTIPTAIVAGIV